MRPLAVPNLPQGPVRLCLAQAGVFAEALRALGVEVLSPAPEPALAPEEREHADLICCHTGGDTVFLRPSQTTLAGALRERGFKVRFTAAPGRDYPANVGLDLALGADFALGRLPFADKSLLAFLQNGTRRLLDVKQGYAKCALCFVTGNAFITEDTGIAAALRGTGCDVLQISPGNVYLSERHHGFFGGASGLLSPDTLAAAGSLSFHRDGGRIRDFLKKHGVRPLELTDGRLTDIGGILPLAEQTDSFSGSSGSERTIL